MGGVELGERNVSLDNIHRVAHALHVPPAGLFPTSAPRRRAVEVAHQAGPASFAKVGSLPHQNRHRPLRAVTTPVPCGTTPASAQPQAECPSTGARAHNRPCQPDEDERDRSRAGEAGAEAPRAGSRHLPRAGPLRPLTEPQDPSTAAGVFGRACWRSSTSSPGTTRTPSGTSAMRVWVMKDRVSASRLAKARARTGML